MAVFDTADVEQTGAPLLRVLPRMASRKTDYGRHSIAVSPNSRKVAFIGPNEFTVTIASCSMLDELLRVDLSIGVNVEPDILGRK